MKPVAAHLLVQPPGVYGTEITTDCALASANVHGYCSEETSSHYKCKGQRVLTC
jgi:hypothetical protein